MPLAQIVARAALILSRRDLHDFARVSSARLLWSMASFGLGRVRGPHAEALMLIEDALEWVASASQPCAVCGEVDAACATAAYRTLIDRVNAWFAFGHQYPLARYELQRAQFRSVAAAAADVVAESAPAYREVLEKQQRGIEELLNPLMQ